MKKGKIAVNKKASKNNAAQQNKSDVNCTAEICRSEQNWQQNKQDGIAGEGLLPSSRER